MLLHTIAPNTTVAICKKRDRTQEVSNSEQKIGMADNYTCVILRSYDYGAEATLYN